jgi:hypothetical protein
MGCPRHWCENSECGQEMIHRDNRRFYESASGFGQIVNRDGPRTFTVGDIDLYVRKWFGSTTLLRLIEHKQPGQPIKDQQARTLTDLDHLFGLGIEHPSTRLRLDPRSGIYVMRGEIFAEASGRRATRLGPQRVWSIRERRWFELDSQAAVFDWLNGKEAAAEAS